MRIYLKQSVYEAAIERINFLFDEFENVVVGMSGGKDSTVCFELCLQVARERNRLPLNALWIDQEGEWQGTVDYMESVMTNPEVKPYWFQMPMVITNNASSSNRYVHCWEEGKELEWMHQKHPISIKNNIYGEQRFHKLFEKIFKVEFPGIKSCYISGVRAEETPKRLMSLTTTPVYKYITWGTLLNKKNQHYTFYPLYDWSYTDIWKVICDNGWSYNRIYDELYRYGATIKDMRISNIHHETSKQSLMFIHEIEPETWERVLKRVDGANTIEHLAKESFTCPSKLPYMFESWKEYAEYLIENIIQEEKNKNFINGVISKYVPIYSDKKINNAFYQVIITTILSSDWDLTKLANYNIQQDSYTYRNWKKGIVNEYTFKYNKFIPAVEMDRLKNG